MTAVRTGGKGAEGISMLLIPRSDGLRTRKIEIGAGSLSATTFVTFEDVKVPVEYLIGEEGNGFRYTMTNFNHERLWIVFQALRGCRTAIEDAMAWAQKREAFGKTIIEQPVVRYKFGNMARKVEALHAWTEQVIYELENLGDKEGWWPSQYPVVVLTNPSSCSLAGWRDCAAQGRRRYCCTICFQRVCQDYGVSIEAFFLVCLF